MSTSRANVCTAGLLSGSVIEDTLSRSMPSFKRNTTVSVIGRVASIAQYSIRIFGVADSRLNEMIPRTSDIHLGAGRAMSGQLNVSAVSCRAGVQRVTQPIIVG